MKAFIDEDLRDAVAEILNVAIGRAAASLSELVDDEVRLSVPFVDFLAPADAISRIERETGNLETVAVREQFEGLVHGDILLLFPEHKSLDLVRHVLGHEIPLDELTELEQEALLEVGNIILNACLGSLSNQLGLPVTGSLPTYVRGKSSQLLHLDAEHHGQQEVVVFLHVDFALRNKDAEGYLAFVMDIVSAHHFIDAIHAYVDRVLNG
jgi:chemotaxis protein CheC